MVACVFDPSIWETEVCESVRGERVPKITNRFKSYLWKTLASMNTGKEATVLGTS